MYQPNLNLHKNSTNSTHSSTCFTDFVTLKRQIYDINDDDDNLNIKEQPDTGDDASEEDEEVNDHKY